MVLGVVGKIGSGKSAVIEYLQEKYNAISFSCDDIAKEIIREKGLESYESEQVFINENLQEQIRNNFHPLVFLRIDENLNNLYNFIEKPYTNKTETSDTDANINNFLNKNNIYSKNNFENIKNFIDKSFNIHNIHNVNKNNFLNKSELLTTVESALPSNDMFNICDKMIYIDCPYEMRVKRLKDSRGYSETKIKQIYDSQEYYEKFYARADFNVYNDGTKDELINKIEEVLNEIYITRKQ